MLYTRTGDKGTSGLFGCTQRFSKDDPVYEALGVVDELNSLLGLCRAYAVESKSDEEKKILRAQECLFIIQAELAGAEKSITKQHIKELEDVIDFIEDHMERPRSFIVPGTTVLSALCDYARAIARRAERTVIKADTRRKISPESRAYLNRLSSFLYALARYNAQRNGRKELTPSY